MNEENLIQQAQSGQKHAFRFLVVRYQRPLFKFLSAYGLLEVEVDDLAQETFLRAYRAIDRYDPQKGATFLTWLLTIAKRLAFDEMSRKHRFSFMSDDQLSELENVSDESAEALLQQNQLKEMMRKALVQLPEPFHSAVALAYVKELSLSEIAEIEKCSLGTVKSRIYRGKKLLLKLMQTSARNEL